MSDDLVLQLTTAANNKNLDDSVKLLLKSAAGKITYDQGIISYLRSERRNVAYYQKSEKETRDACSKKIEELRGQVALLKESIRGHQIGLKRALQRLDKEKARSNELDLLLKQKRRRNYFKFF